MLFHNKNKSFLAAFIIFCLLFGFQNCSKTNFNKYDAASVAISKNSNSTAPGTPKYAVAVPSVPVCTFEGRNVSENSSVVAFQNSTVPSGSVCVSEKRICKGGVLSGSYIFPACSPGAQQVCPFNQGTVADGQSVQAFPSSSVPSGTLCVPQMRTCHNGILSGTATFASCSTNGPRSCLFNGATILHGNSINAFVNSTEPANSVCEPHVRTCVDGTLLGTGNYGTCAVGAPATCSLAGLPVADGQEMKAFQRSAVASNEICIFETRICRNGTLTGSFTNLTCDVAGARPVGSGPSFCQPMTSKSCFISNGTGSQICNAAGTDYGACEAVSCNGGFTKSGSGCVPEAGCAAEAPGFRAMYCPDTTIGIIVCSLQGLPAAKIGEVNTGTCSNGSTTQYVCTSGPGDNRSIVLGSTVCR